MGEFFIVVLMGIFVFMAVRLIVSRPDLFQAKYLSKGFGTLGILALGLVLLIGLGVSLLRVL